MEAGKVEDRHLERASPLPWTEGKKKESASKCLDSQVVLLLSVDSQVTIGCFQSLRVLDGIPWMEKSEKATGDRSRWPSKVSFKR